jgi:hypothetical protein
MTLVQQRIFGGFSLKLKNKCGSQNAIKKGGDEEERVFFFGVEGYAVGLGT